MLTALELDLAETSVEKAVALAFRAAVENTPAPLERRSNQHGRMRAQRPVDSDKIVPLRGLAANANASLLALLIGALDEIDYGMIVLDAAGQVAHANHIARTELARSQHLCVEGDQLVASAFEQRDALASAIARASRGTRSLVELSHPEASSAHLTAAVVPLGQNGESSSVPSPVLVITGRQQVCEQISLQFFAHRYGLSRSEQIVLLGLVQGYSVQDVAIERGLALSTVRSQVKDIRVKTRCKSVRELMAKVSALPPLVSSIKGGL